MNKENEVEINPNNFIRDNNILERKRTKTVSKNGNMYYKTSAEVNRAGQLKHYYEHKEAVSTKSILFRLETKGNIPQYQSYVKYPSILTEEVIMISYKKFRDINEDPEKFIATKKKLMTLLKKIDYNKIKIDL